MDWTKKIQDFLAILIYFLPFAVANCSYYSFSGSTLPAHIKTVAVPLFEDQTAEFGIKEKLTDAIIGQITQDNTLKIADLRTADSLLKGNIVQLIDRPETYDAQERVQSYRVYITIEVEFQDLKKRKVLWKERLTQWGSYAAGTGGPEDRQVGIEEAIQKLAEDVLNRTVSSW